MEVFNFEARFSASEIELSTMTHNPILFLSMMSGFNSWKTILLNRQQTRQSFLLY